MNNLKNFYKNKKIFITGHTGFKGAWLTSTLIEFGSKIMGYSLKDERTKIYKKICYYNKINNVFADILDFKTLKKKLVKFKPDIIFHLAAQSLVSESFRSPVKTVQTNINGTLNILEISKKIKSLKSLVIITSDKCYLNKEYVRGYKENDTLGGDDLYSASKASAEILIRAYYYSFLKNKHNIRIASTRAGNVIGGGDWANNRIIPDCIKSWSKNKSVFVRSPKSTRPWQHVLEALSGYLVFSEKLSKNEKLHGEVFNFGPSNGKNFSVLDVIKNMKRIWKKVDFKIVTQKNKLYYESRLLKLNSNKAKKILKWKCVLNFNETINLVSSWYKSFYEKTEKNENISINQIKLYEKLFVERIK